MLLLRLLILSTARALEAFGSLLYRLSNVLNGLVPALLSPADLQSLMRQHYIDLYSQGSVVESPDYQEEGLRHWEQEILDRHHLRSGEMLVLASGWGREAIAIAQRGMRVVAVEANAVAAKTTQQRAKAVGAPVFVLQADMLKLPTASQRFTGVLLSQRMYSAIAGRAERQEWLRRLRHILSPNGVVILNFLSEAGPVSRLRALWRTFGVMLAKLPGANAAYQLGDECHSGHFLHWFQDEQEIRSELIATGAHIDDLDWPRGFAVLSYQPSGSQSA